MKNTPIIDAKMIDNGECFFYILSYVLFSVI